MGAVLADAWRWWRRDRDLLIAIAGFFLFLPHFAILTLVPAQPALQANPTAGQTAMRTWLSQMADWYWANGVALIAGDLMALAGALLIYLLYLDRSRPVLAGAFGQAAWLLPRYLLASFLIVLPVQIGMILFLPGIYIAGRLLVVGPVLVAERPLGALAALGRSVTLTRGSGLVLAGLACLMLLGGSVLAAPFLMIGESLGGAPLANPVTAVLLDAAAAAATTAVALGAILVRIALYRRIVPASNGI